MHIYTHHIHTKRMHKNIVKPLSYQRLKLLQYTHKNIQSFMHLQLLNFLPLHTRARLYWTIIRLSICIFYKFMHYHRLCIFYASFMRCRSCITDRLKPLSHIASNVIYSLMRIYIFIHHYAYIMYTLLFHSIHTNIYKIIGSRVCIFTICLQITR